VGAVADLRIDLAGQVDAQAKNMTSTLVVDINYGKT